MRSIIVCICQDLQMNISLYIITGKIVFSSSECAMMTSSNGNIFCDTGPVCWEFTGHRLILLTIASFCVFFGLCLNKLLSNQSCGWWFETSSRSLWRHCNVLPSNAKTSWCHCNSLKPNSAVYVVFVFMFSFISQMSTILLFDLPKTLRWGLLIV